MVGVLPIAINIPKAGNAYRFVRPLVVNEVTTLTFAYRRKYGSSVTGGYVYRGDKRSSFYGVYIFGDYTSRRIFGLTQRNRSLQTVRQIGMSPQNIASFGTDERGEIYLVGYEGMVYKLDFAGATFDELPAVRSARSTATPPAGTLAGRPDGK